MFVIILGFFDMLAAIALLLLHFDIGPARIGLLGGGYLLGKGLMFPKDIASIVDILIAFYIAGAVLFGLHTFLAYLMAAYLVEKFVISFL